MNATTNQLIQLRLALPKGSMQKGVSQLLSDAGIPVRATARGYRPVVGLEGVETKLLKPQSILEMLAAGTRDLGFAGADWVAELDADVVEILDTGLDPVQLVAAAPRELLVDGALPAQPLRVASEYARLTQRWIAERGLNAAFLRSYGATEVLPPEDADCIVDNTATGATLKANGLVITDVLMTSSTRLYASPAAMADDNKRARIEDIALLLRGVLDARKRVLVELNVDAEDFDAVVERLPCMRQPTVSKLAGSGFAVRVAVLRKDLPTLIPDIRALGGRDILVTGPSLIVPGGAR